ncbi:protein of unknown function DUF1566 [Candidatus Magnetoovum chiemensis]|nr:protein of unknown function DUF1566 [Candidatus Magnetoovum chiemensis]
MTAGSSQSGEGSEVRFKEIERGIILDTTTGLLWTKDASTPKIGKCSGGVRTWNSSRNYIKSLNGMNYLGHNDWRLPEIDELTSLIDYSQYDPALPSGHIFENVQSSYYWSATTYVYAKADAWLVDMCSGSVFYYAKSKGYGYYAWPVLTG